MKKAPCTVRLAAILGAALLSTSSLSCSSSKAPSGSPSAGPCSGVAVDEFKEMLVVDPGIITDARTKNASAGPWSFRFAIENMAPPSADASDFVRSWLVEWATASTYNGYPLDRDNEGRTAAMYQQILCPWELRSPANGCNADCTVCAVDPPKLDLAQAPFRLMAMINRMDLREQPDGGAGGEARLAFALTNGPGDDAASPAMPMALIFEYRLPDTLSPKAWADQWHALGRFPAFDDRYKAALEVHTRSWVARNSSPSRPNGSALGQIRTNESTLNWIWQLRQFEIGDDGQLHLAGTRNTPPASLNGSQTLQDYITANADAIQSQKFVLPTQLLAGSADSLIYRWSFTVDPELSQKFAGNTCNGCHSQVNPNIDSNFHISPFRSGTESLSKFLYDPTNRAGDELTQRVTSFRTALCSQ